jgi:hypothetical protein
MVKKLFAASAEFKVVDWEYVQDTALTSSQTPAVHRFINPMGHS